MIISFGEFYDDWVFKKIIPSEDVRDFMKKEGRVFSSFEIAVLIYNSDQNYYEKNDQLRFHAKITSDTALKEMIEERIAWDEEDLRSFEEDSEGYVYILNSKEFVPEDCYCGVYANAKLAYEQGLKLGQDFSIEKHLIIGFNGVQPIKKKWYRNPYLSDTQDLAACVEEWESDSSECMSLHYNKDGELEYYNGGVEREDAEMLSMLFDPNRFENAYIEVPNPFEKGDIVRVVGSERQGIVLTSQRDWEEYKVIMSKTKSKDFVDASITVDFLCEDGEFCHDHVNPVFLEKLENNKATLLARKYHFGQKDKQGKEYMLHPLRVMMRLDDLVDRMIAVLHDVLEDTECTEEILLAEGIPKEVVEGVKFLTRKEDEKYFSYIERIRKNERCRRIKQIDLMDNLREGCPESLQQRYRRALEVLRYED